MLPLYDENPTYGKPYVTYGLIAANAVVFLLLLIIQYGFGDYELLKFYYDWALVPTLVWNGSHLHTFITSMFMHGGFLHFGGNMLYLYIFGNNVEDSMGHARYLLFYVLCGLTASAAQVMTDTGSIIPMLGASGAIAGVLGAYLITFPKAKVTTWALFLIIKIPASLVLGFWFLLQLFSGIGSLAVSGGGVAYFAHIGGFVAGMLLAIIFRKRNYRAKEIIRDDWDRIYYR